MCFRASVSIYRKFAGLSEVPRLSCCLRRALQVWDTSTFKLSRALAPFGLKIEHSSDVKSWIRCRRRCG